MEALTLLLPETYLLLVVLGLFVATLAKDTAKVALSWLGIAAFMGILVAAASLGQSGVLFHGAYRVDGLSQFFKLAVALGFFVTAVNSLRQPEVSREQRADYYLFLSLSAFGLMLIASCVELITLYVALEISSYSLYALVPLRAQRREAAEAAIKYVLFGAAATAVSLYGFSLIIAGQNTTYLADLATKSWSFAHAPVAALGLTLFMAGFFYKLALFPFHFWCPDVYDGASNETAAYIATLPKLGATVALIRFAALLKPGLEVTTVIAVLGAASMTFGNLSALAQKDVKRLLGFSSVAHAGYVTLGLVAGTAAGLAAASFYSLVYILMNLTGFWVLCRLSPDGRNVAVTDLRGLYRRQPYLAFILAVAAFALVGLPPTAGFMGKLFLLSSAWDKGYDWLVIVAAVNTAISIYYYLNLVRHAYTVEEEPSFATAQTGIGAWALGGALAVAVLVLGAAPDLVFRYAMAAGKVLVP